MRVSALKGDPGYSPHSVGVNVFLDGEPISHCFTADDDQGLVVVADLDENGHYRIDLATEQVIMRYRFGIVRIERSPCPRS